MTAALPAIHQSKCLNQHLSDNGDAICDLCRNICPAQAIDLNEQHLPLLNENRCTGCAACVHVCPSDAITHQEIDPVSIVRQTSELARQGKTSLRITCSEVADSSADLCVPCHAAWDPLLLACMAADGIQAIHLHGINQCASCPVQHGDKIMLQTEKEYALLNKALGIHLNISRQETIVSNPSQRLTAPEPARRAFFRNLIPSMAQSASMAVAQIGQAASQSLQQKAQEHTDATSSRLPVLLQLFLRALPRLNANFTPIPPIPGLPMGAIQADASCTACNRCVEQCPTQALSIKEFGANKVLEFQPDACIGCQHCVAVCPENALESLPSISLPTILARRTRPLVMVTG